jgi:hypothetical protein
MIRVSVSLLATLSICASFPLPAFPSPSPSVYAPSSLRPPRRAAYPGRDLACPRLIRVVASESAQHPSALRVPPSLRRLAGVSGSFLPPAHQRNSSESPNPSQSLVAPSAASGRYIRVCISVHGLVQSVCPSHRPLPAARAASGDGGSDSEPLEVLRASLRGLTRSLTAAAPARTGRPSSARPLRLMGCSGRPASSWAGTKGRADGPRRGGGGARVRDS